MRYLLPALFFLLSLTNLNAQGIAVGAKTGMLVSSFYGSGDETTIDFESKVGFSIGGYLEVASSDLFALQPELNLVFTGTRRQQLYIDQSSSSSIPVQIESNVNLTSIEIPLLAKFSTGYDFRFYGIAGPLLGIRLAESMKGDYIPAAGATPVLDGELDLDTNLIDNYFGLVFGAGGVYQNFLLDIRYTVGISDITEDGETDITPTETTNRMNALNISFGYTWIF